MNPPRWMSEEGPDSDVAVSSRCRLARNIADYPFPWRADELQSKTAAEQILSAAERCGGALRDSHAFAAARLSPPDLDRLIEWRYASKTWAEGGANRWLVIARGGALSLLVNEEDHLRIQCILPGSLVESCWAKASEIDAALSRNLQFAWRDQIGFLTAALTNAGTGLRASVLLHLPGLRFAGKLESRLAGAEELGSAVRGLYGEGTAAAGDLFQVSNRRSFGVDPRDLLTEVVASTRLLIEAEREAREKLFGPDAGRLWLAEEVYSALTELYRRDLTPVELLRGISILRLGAARRLIRTPLAAAAEWIAIAGLSASSEQQADRGREEFERTRRSAALRQRLRGLLDSAGTFAG